MRYSFAAFAAFAILGTPAAVAQSASPEACTGISDSLLRLRCFDDAVRTKSSTPGPSTVSFDFASYPAPLYRGPIKAPRFTNDRAHMYRTRIREALAEGVSFAGDMAVVQFGCGTGCSSVLVVSFRTGEVYDFLPDSDFMNLDLEYKPNSRLLVARWKRPADERCMTGVFVWTGRMFESRGATQLGLAEKC